MLLIKRYFFPFLFSVALYSIVYFIFGNDTPYFNVGLVLSVLLAYFIRLCDDISDYEKDESEGKSLIRKETLIISSIWVSSAFFALTFLSKSYLMFIPLAVILSQFLFKDKQKDVIKPFFMPVIVIAVVFSFFTPSLWLFVISLIVIIADVFLIIKKKRRSNI